MQIMRTRYEYFAKSMRIDMKSMQNRCKPNVNAMRIWAKSYDIDTISMHNRSTQSRICNKSRCHIDAKSIQIYTKLKQHLYKVNATSIHNGATCMQIPTKSTFAMLDLPFCGKLQNSWEVRPEIASSSVGGDHPHNPPHSPPKSRTTPPAHNPPAQPPAQPSGG